MRRREFLTASAVALVTPRINPELPGNTAIANRISQTNVGNQPIIGRPYYRRLLPTPQNVLAFNTDRIDLLDRHLSPYPSPDQSQPGAAPDLRPLANSLFDARAAAAVVASVVDPISVRVEPEGQSNVRGLLDPKALLQSKIYFNVAPSIFILTPKCLAVMAYADYFPNSPHIKSLRSKVSEAIMKASPGWCGTFGPDVSDQGSQSFEGDYDMTEMFLIPLVYGYYDQLTPAAQERLVTLLLARGRIHRASIAGKDDQFTSGGAPNDWSRAGFVSVIVTNFDIPETENHVLTIATARYLTNQLLYQRFRSPNFDNRRNGNPGESRPNCTDQVLGLLRNELRNDFAEYNAKNYQEETRHALLNLCSYAYDSEVRLGARMVLDYISAHIAVSSNDLRRMVPFRRRNEGINVLQIPNHPGFMDVSLLDAHGADPMAAQFALLAGNTRAYQLENTRVWPGESAGARPWAWAITPNFGPELTLGALSNYRLPPSIHDLFVDDLHRRFFQRIHRRRMLEEPGQQRNCDNKEIYAGSPSYLITAGGEPATFVIPGHFGFGNQPQNLGVAVPTSFMPTGLSAGKLRSLQQLADAAGISGRPLSVKAAAKVFGISPPFSFTQLSATRASWNVNNAQDLIQFLHFSDRPGETENYGVAPDFACGFAFRFPAWTGVKDGDGVFFVNRKSGDAEPAGFFLAIIKSQDFVLLEALDTWLHPEVSFDQFQRHVRINNPNIVFKSGQETVYTTFFGNRIHFVIWTSGEQDNHTLGSKIINIEYGAGDPADTLIDAGNDTDSSRFLSGTVLKSRVTQSWRSTTLSSTPKITLDWSDLSHPVRISEAGEIEEAGGNHEVWLDFNWAGPFEGDFYRPLNSITTAARALADGGVIKIVPGATKERGPISIRGKRMKLVAPIGGVTIGTR